MDIKKANQLFKAGKLEEALKSYKEITNDNPLYEQAQFNIQLVNSKLNKSPDSLNVKSVDAPNIDIVSMLDGPLVSVIMPVFNVAPYLDASIMSVLNQTYKNIELIIVNDASTDNGLNIIRMFEKQDSRIKVINLEFNTLGGAGIPSNIGVDSAKGDYIAYADSDDILDKSAIEKMVTTALSTQAQVVLADFCTFNNSTRVVEPAYDKERWAGLPLNTCFNPKEYPSVLKLSAVPWRKLYQRSFLKLYDIHFPEGDYFYEDNPLHWLVIINAKKIVIIDYIVAYHRMDRVGQTMGADEYKLIAHIQHINTTLNYFLTSDTEIDDIFWIELLRKLEVIKWTIERQNDESISRLFGTRIYSLAKRIMSLSEIPTSKLYGQIPSLKKTLDKLNIKNNSVDLSIVIPVYNCEDLLENTLENLQSIKGISIEVFLIDDGSTDNSKMLIDRFSDKYENFYSFSQNNKGAGSARNSIIPLATGEYTYFLDADDTVDIKNLEEAVLYSKQSDFDLTLFKYNLHYYEKDSLNEMFTSDKKTWERLLKAKSNKEKKLLALGMINYPWIRIIKTTLLHDENIFFGKTVVHNDIPYHWHSLAVAKKIGIFDKAVCNHRKFEEREQITNIVDERRMMVFEAQRYTQHILEKYEIFDEALPIWKNFITNLLNWAADRIPSELKSDYAIKQKEVIDGIDQLIQNKKLHNNVEGINSNIGFYRIIGNSINGLHVENQSLGSLRHIVEHESNYKDVDKYFVLNRIIDEDIKQTLISYLQKHDISYLVIDFNLENFKNIGYDLTTMPNSYYWFEKKSAWHTLICNTAVRRLKNAYLMNNNGSRNFALAHGKNHHRWTMPWDGNCFLSDQSFNMLIKNLDSTDAKYVLTPMERVTNNDLIDRNSSITNSVEEPQISFRQDALEIFNENRVYGSQPKVELFKRIGFKGSWDKIVYLYPWEKKLEYDISKDVGSFTISSGVFRLHSGNSEAAVDGRTRSHTRARGISDNIDSVEVEYLRSNLSKSSYKADILKLLYKAQTYEKISTLHKEVFISQTTDINTCSSDVRVYVTLYLYGTNSLTDKYVSKYDLTKLHPRENLNLENIHKFKAALNQMLTCLLVSLSMHDLEQSIKSKIDIIMLLYYYYDKKEQKGYGKNTHIDTMIEIIKILFKEVFEYDVIKDLKLAKAYK
ncbi:glycosyltransferase family 2 protein [Psychrobacter sp. CAL346-MNA-CIBAN-0220]|uniref:glycosyltransferase family 2 protein n=1 Tax=Psychrobacter sp. CAL346-MNA-CIBAN-0220 TaxID=3140457 RepID=UPI0033293B2B